MNRFRLYLNHQSSRTGFVQATSAVAAAAAYGLTVDAHGDLYSRHGVFVGRISAA